MAEVQNENVSFEELIVAAQRGDWELVDFQIVHAEHQTEERIAWAHNEGLSSSDQNIRDLAATLLDESDAELPQETLDRLEQLMKSDPHHIVRFRLAIALWKRRVRSEAVREMMEAAKVDEDVGSEARAWGSVL